jgi:hypothetical protein
MGAAIKFDIPTGRVPCGIKKGKMLYHKPAELPKCRGSSGLEDIISDLKIHASANCEGFKLLKTLIDDFLRGVEKLCINFTHKSAVIAVRGLLQVADDRSDREPISAVDQLTGL